MRITADRDVCIGSGTCVLTADDLFDQDDEATVIVLAEYPSPAQGTRARDAVDRCPSGALRLREDPSN